MFTGRKLIARYVVNATLPYVMLAAVLLTAILFTQQTGRFAELALNADLPFSLAGEIAAALLPSVMMLTLPVAVLAGIVIGFARMGSDSEIVAIRAAGVGTWSLVWPVLVIGLLATGVTTYLQFKEAPRAARDLRQAALQAALRKLDSPVEPRTFNTELPGYVIYVRDGDKSLGSWERVFIYAQQPDGVSIVTARSGRIDSSNEKSELVLSDAVRTKIPKADSTERNYVVERLEQLRISINTGRAALLEHAGQKDLQVEELEWGDLKQQAHSSSPDERNEAERTINRRMALSAAPLVFALFGGLLGMRVRRGGRGAGVVVSLSVVIVYYLITLLGESLARGRSVSAITGEWMATAVMLLVSLVLLRSGNIPRPSLLRRRLRKKGQTQPADYKKVVLEHTVGAGRWGFPSLLDTSLFRTLAVSFLLGFVSLVSIFIIFTLFELWRFIALNNVPSAVVAKYLLFLLPFVAVELFPATMLITVLITYALLARRNEATAWWASGQSVYRLMMPGLSFALAIGAGTWLVQEHLMPHADQPTPQVSRRPGVPTGMTHKNPRHGSLSGLLVPPPLLTDEAR